MWRQRLRTPLSATRRRSLPFSSRPSANDTIFPGRISTSSSSTRCLSSEEEFVANRNSTCHFPWSLPYYGKAFCSASTGRGVGTCWNCSLIAQNVPFLVCESCGTVQPVDHSVDYFQMFGFREKRYEIENDNLEVKYKDWQKKLHPDLVHSKSKKEKQYAVEQSSRVNNAYRTLADPLSRAVYILKLADVEVDEEKTIYEPELLAEIMEIREAVEEAADPQALSQIQTLVQEKLKHWTETFANKFRSQKFEDAQACIQRMIYYKRAYEEIVKKL